MCRKTRNGTIISLNTNRSCELLPELRNYACEDYIQYVVIFKFETSAYFNGLTLKIYTHPRPVYQLTTLQISASEVHAGRARKTNKWPIIIQSGAIF